MVDRQYFPTAAQAARKQKHMTQAELADTVGVTHVAMSKYLRGLLIPRTIVFLRICDALALNPAQMTWPELEAEREAWGD